MPRLQLLKIDVQGFEASCVASAGEALRRVDNIFLEVQDLPSNHSKIMYVGTRDIGEIDELLGPYGFVRQYCEDNNTPPMREFNCLWTMRGQPPLWVTGRPQPKGRPAVEYDTTRPPTFAGVLHVAPLLTASTAGALDHVVHTRPVK